SSHGGRTTTATIQKMASNKLGTLLSSQTTTPTNQHTHTRHASQQETNDPQPNHRESSHKGAEDNTK
ncbi:MAG TPA: hypothetical protein K8V32_12100, partial [Enteractinococcus helveticum]